MAEKKLLPGFRVPMDSEAELHELRGKLSIPSMSQFVQQMFLEGFLERYGVHPSKVLGDSYYAVCADNPEGILRPSTVRNGVSGSLSYITALAASSTTLGRRYVAGLTQDGGKTWCRARREKEVDM